MSRTPIESMSANEIVAELKRLFLLDLGVPAGTPVPKGSAISRTLDYIDGSLRDIPVDHCDLIAHTPAWLQDRLREERAEYDAKLLKAEAEVARLRSCYLNEEPTSTDPNDYYAPATYHTPVESMSAKQIFRELRELNAIWSQSRSDCLNASPESMGLWIFCLEKSLEGLPPYSRCLPAFTPDHLLGTLEWSRARYHEAALAGKFRPLVYETFTIPGGTKA